MTNAQNSPVFRSKFDPNISATSSLNRYFLCNYCGTSDKFGSKRLLIDHLKRCCNNNERIGGKTDEISPTYDEIVPSNSSKELKGSYCHVCNLHYRTVWDLRYHIRQTHFNLKAKTPYCNMKKVNQVWFEKVQNSNNIIEVRKTGANSLVIRKLSEKTAIKVNDMDTDVVDLTHLYPTLKRVRVKTGKVTIQCDICQKRVLKRYLVHHKLFKHKVLKEKVGNVKST
ncbi:uncharacterized protein LOC131845303 [Achroia grisella]|uniref:uncharacterized protein LOC131845303 n=1 Tax=Achroia grisella TaxID=688607 RepID=UPI0027D2F3E8|nr:uncharacterized protein LOC131845303 [Achroia grisella]